VSRSWTTRARRPGEAPDAYTFVDRARFEAFREAGGFLEWAEVLDDLYGTPHPTPPPGCDVVLEIDVQGARQVLASNPDAICVLLLAPSVAVQEERLRGRGDSEQHVRRRVALGLEEEQEGRELADAVIVNDELETTVAQLLAIIEGARARARGGSRPIDDPTSRPDRA